MTSTLLDTQTVRADSAGARTGGAYPAASPPAHAAAVFASFDQAYAHAYGADRGKFWTDRYAPGLAPYANLVHARNRRVMALAGGGERTALLDVGSGYGDLLYMLRDRFEVLRGVDPSAQTIGLAEHNLRMRGVTNDYEFRQGVAEGLPLADESFDTVLMLDTYEHVEPRFRVRALEEARRVLKPGGSLILVTPSRGLLRFWTVVDNLLTMPRQLRARRAKKGKRTPIQLWSFTPKDYCEVFETRRSVLRGLMATGFDVERFERVSFYPAPERGGLLGPALEASPPESRLVRWTLAWVNVMERLRFLNQKMLFKATRPREEGPR